MDSDDDLIERFQVSGDEQAFDLLVERHQRDVYRLAYRFVSNHHDANDVAQEAFVRVYRSLHRFRHQARFKTWLYRIVANVGLDFAIQAKRSRMRLVSLDQTPSADPATSLVTLLATEQSQRLRGAIEALPSKQRQTVILKVFHELKFSEVANVMKCSVGTAKANYFHAVQGLKRRLGVDPGNKQPA